MHVAVDPWLWVMRGVGEGNTLARGDFSQD
jgi:hypothetical protein